MSESEVISDDPALSTTTAVYDGPPTRSPMEIESEAFKEKMKYIGLQIQLLKPEEKTKFTNDFKVVGKSLNTLRKVMKQKQEPDSEFEINYKFCLCVVLMLSIFVFFGYKLFKSLTDRDRKREEKRLAKQTKKKK